MSINNLPKRPIKPWPSFDETSSEKKRSAQRIQVVLLATVIFHLVVIFWAPWPQLMTDFKKPHEVELQLVTQKDQPRFVETNPNAPSNDPDETLNIAARAQQSAQEDPAAFDKNHLPTINGDVEMSQAIVPGNMLEYERYAVAESASGPQGDGEPTPLGARRQEGWEVDESQLTGEGIRPGVEEGAAELSEDDSTIIMASPKQIRMAEQGQRKQSSDRSSPRPRPKVDARVIPAPLMKSNSRATQVGVVAIDAKMTPFGLYKQRMMEAISQQWYLLASHLKFLQTDINAQVVLEIVFDKHGAVNDLKVIQSSASEAATLVCQDAIMSRSPFGDWDPSMVDLFGDQQTIRIHFYYR